MKNISLVLASTLSIAFVSPVIDKAISKPTGSKLPEVGIVKKNIPSSVGGCFYWQSNEVNNRLESESKDLRKRVSFLERKEQGKGSRSVEYQKVLKKLTKNEKYLQQKTLLFDIYDIPPTMNLNGQDTILSRISGSDNPVMYKYDDVIVKISTTQVWGKEAATTDIKGTMLIKSSKNQRVIKIKGVCWAD